MALATGEKLYLNEERKDVVFLVGPDEQRRVRFPAHKLILSSCSSAFAAMLSPRFQEGRSGEVVIKDVTPAAFRNVLQFAYAGTIHQIPLVSTFKEILYAADKYLMVDLSKICFDHLQNTTISLDNFWDFFNIVCTFYSESMSPKIVINTFQFLDEHAETLLSNDEFINLNSEAVLRIATRSSLCDISEITILQRVFLWSKIECCRQNIEVTAENERKVLEEIKYHIRYSLIPRAEMLENDLIMRTVLTENEKKIIVDNSLRVTVTLPLPWNVKLLSLTRGKCRLNQWRLFNLSDNLVPPHKAIDLFLVAATDCVFDSVGINYISPNCSDVKITGEITDLNGNIYSTWVDKGAQSVCPREEDPIMTVTTGKPMCLRRFKLYKLSLVVENGHFVKKYNSSGFFNDLTSKFSLFLGNFPTDTDTSTLTLNTLKSYNFWEKVMTSSLTVPHISKINRNTFVSTVSIII